ncbi:hypothetical protein Q7F20_09280 [Curtobacterium sp. A7_M15]|uniref:hypothetical protein n=1 Tax=Curtobacterium sp. A7_M15 TaxID=3065241 RepID=UPI002737B81B|nr:hypothetical protein [Curtobacterium sp. A7_M15]MDP4333563.1 hypothetical protein [Curtobacterium sp. A7_M15]
MSKRFVPYVHSEMLDKVTADEELSRRLDNFAEYLDSIEWTDSDKRDLNLTFGFEDAS